MKRPRVARADDLILRLNVPPLSHTTEIAGVVILSASETLDTLDEF